MDFGRLGFFGFLVVGHKSPLRFLQRLKQESVQSMGAMAGSP